MLTDKYTISSHSEYQDEGRFSSGTLHKFDDYIYGIMNFLRDFITLRSFLFLHDFDLIRRGKSILTLLKNSKISKVK